MELKPSERLAKFKKKSVRRIQSHVKFWKLKMTIVASSRAYQKLITWKNNRAVFQLQVPKAVIKGVISRSYCCYGKLLYYEHDNNVFTNMGKQYFDGMTVASSNKQWL